MKFEVLKRSHLKRNMIIGVLVVTIISACVLTFTKARYRTTQSIKVVEGQINYKVPDFNMVALYVANEGGEYVESDVIPTSGYTLNMTESYCGQSQDGEIVKDDTVSFVYENGSMTFSNVTKKGTKCYLYFDKHEEPNLLADAILERKDIQTRSNFNVSFGSDTTGIIYQTADNDGTSYFFAGDTDENWVSFAGFYWRIIRINGNGSIQMIYSGENTGIVTDANRTGTTTQISLDGSTTSFNIEYNRSEYVGLRFTQNSQHGNASNSDILDTMNTWYTTNISSSDRNYVDTSAWFCSDREMASGYSWSSQPSSTIYYAAYERIITTRSPSLQCSNASDKLTTSNGVGLITIDEVNFAGSAAANDSYYLYTGQSYWTMSPAYFFASEENSHADMFYVGGNGSYSMMWVDRADKGIRPVINLKSDTVVTGTGTSTDPFEVVTS